MTHQKNHYPWTVYIDGASRNNPGKSGIGIVIEKNGKAVVHEGFYVGIQSNNQAEYLALLLALYFIHQHAQPTDSIQIFSDSELLVRQMNNIYKVKNKNLKPLYLLAQTLAQGYSIYLSHIKREHNMQADSLANKGIDTKNPLPAQFIDILNATITQL